MRLVVCARPATRQAGIFWPSSQNSPYSCGANIITMIQSATLRGSRMSLTAIRFCRGPLFQFQTCKGLRNWSKKIERSPCNKKQSVEKTWWFYTFHDADLFVFVGDVFTSVFAIMVSIYKCLEVSYIKLPVITFQSSKRGWNARHPSEYLEPQCWANDLGVSKFWDLPNPLEMRTVGRKQWTLGYPFILRQTHHVPNEPTMNCLGSQMILRISKYFLELEYKSPIFGLANLPSDWRIFTGPVLVFNSPQWLELPGCSRRDFARFFR